MASPFNFTTKNDNIVGKIEFEVLRDSNSYTVSFKVKYKRKNDWEGNPTNGTIKYNVYVNNSVAASGSKKFTVPNGGNWVTLVTGSKTINLDTLNSGTYTVGYSSVDDTSGATVKAFDCDKQTSGSETVSAYAGTLTTSPTISDLVDNGDNTFSFNFSTPGNPTNNSLTNTLTTTVEGDYPTSTSVSVNSGISDSRTYSGKSDTNPTFRANVSLSSDPDYGDTKTASASESINFWKAPDTQPTPIIQPMRNGNNVLKVTPKCVLRCQWDMAPPGNSNSSAFEHNGCRFYFLIKRKGTSTWESYGEGAGDNNWKYIDVFYEDKTTPLTTAKNSPGFVFYKVYDSDSFYVDIDSETYNLQKEDRVQVVIQPWTTNINRGGNRRWWIGYSSYSIEKEIESAGIVDIKQSANSWCEGQIYIKTVDGWLESDGVYIKGSSDWEESI